MSKPAFAALLLATGVLGVAAGWAPARQTVPEAVPEAVPQGAAQVAPRPARQVALKDKYHTLEVEKFEVQKDVKLPSEYIQLLQDEILKQFQSSEKFKEVLRGGENPGDAAAGVLRLTGTVTYFDPGSRGKRYIGFGAGAAEVLVHVIFVDRSTGESLIEEEVRGVMSGGLFGGGTKNVRHEFAQKLVNTTKLLLEKPVPAHAESMAKPPEGNPPPTAASLHVVTMSSGDFDKAQTDLNAEAAAGYRLTGFIQKGSKNADIAMEPAATPPQVYQYRVLHVLLVGNLQKDLNMAGEMGFRFCSHTLAQFRGVTASAIIEKPPVPSKTRYQYRVHAAMQLSNAQKDIQKDQSEGFSLVGTLEIGNVHIVLMEQAIEKAGE